MKFVLKSTYPCLVKAGSEEFEVDENDIVEIEDEDFLFVYPTASASQIPFYINLQNPVENENFSIFLQNNQHLIVLERPKNLFLATKKTLYFSGKRCDISAGTRQVTFESDSTKISLAIAPSGAVEDIYKIKDYACVQYSRDLYAFSVKDNRIAHFSGKLRRDGDKILVSREYNDSEQRQRNSTFKFGEKIDIEHEEFIHNASGNHQKKLSPYKVLESVLAKDFAFAHSFLSEELKNKIKPSQIGEFFGNFTSILPISATEFITISEKNKNFVTFEIENDKICDINVEELTRKSPAI